MVVDLSGGPNATSYPVRYMETAPKGGFTNSVYKSAYSTTNLVFRRVHAGSFIMGSNQSNTAHRVTLTKPFYMGIFEVTQKQWELVSGSNPCSDSSYGRGNTYPVHYVSYNMIRGSTNGANWPSSPAVDATSFLGKLQARTSLSFDLPTEAQWEYACRAGTTTDCYWGSADIDDYCWYGDNSSDFMGTYYAPAKAHVVGKKRPNAWGFYDMIGNEYELCLDRYGTLSYGTDPCGVVSGSDRVIRGCSWNSYDYNCTSAFRSNASPSSPSFRVGFRLSLTGSPYIENQ